MLQRFVFTRDLDKVFAAVKQVGGALNPAGMELKTTGYHYVPVQGLGLAGITIAPTPELLKYQQAIVDAVAPYSAQEGTAAAFVQNTDGTPVNEGVVPYVNGFVPQHIGKDYSPHVTVGLGKEDFVKQMMAAPYTPFTFKIAGVSVYHLGDYGTAQEALDLRRGDPLPSWNDGKAKQSIVDFVAKVTRKARPTLCRSPSASPSSTTTARSGASSRCTSSIFSFDRIKTLAAEHPEWKEKEPFKSVLTNDLQAFGATGQKGLLEVRIATTHAGMTVEEFQIRSQVDAHGTAPAVRSAV